VLPFEPGVAGCDEAGRGSLAGPVVCAAVVLADGFDTTGIDDSKRLTPAQRESASIRIRVEAVWAVEVAEVQEVDRLNVLWASIEGMRRALLALPEAPCRAVIDGDRPLADSVCPTTALVKGDAKHAAVAAASILAKVARDAIMVDMDTIHPGYGFAEHFGYGTPPHLEAIRRLGPCPIHRRTFEPVQTMLNQLVLPLGTGW